MTYRRSEQKERRVFDPKGITRQDIKMGAYSNRGSHAWRVWTELASKSWHRLEVLRAKEWQH